jgi:hypothetical protein
MAPYDLQPKIGHHYSESPGPTRPASGLERAPYHEDFNASPTKRPQTTHVSSPRRRWNESPQKQQQDYDQQELDVPPSPSIGPMTSIYRQPGQQFTHESSDMLDRSRSRNRSAVPSRNQDIIDESPTREQQRAPVVEVQGLSLSPTRGYREDIQPKIGHHYSRSPSPPPLQRSRPMTSRSSSRNAMTQVDVDLGPRSNLGSASQNGRSSPPVQRGYMEISGRESRAASRAEMSHSKTVPNNLNNQNGGGGDYNYQQQQQQQRPMQNSRSMSRSINNGGGDPAYQQQQDNSRRMSYSRHYEHNNQHQNNGGYQSSRNSNNNNNNRNNGFSNNNSDSDPSEQQQLQQSRGGMRPSTSLTLLPLQRDVTANSFRDTNKYSRPGSDWNLTTTKRAYR